MISPANHVMIVPESACGSCKSRKACGMAESAEKVLTIVDAHSHLYKEGDEVEVSTEKVMGMFPSVTSDSIWLMHAVCAKRQNNTAHTVGRPKKKCLFMSVMSVLFRNNRTAVVLR